MPLTLTPLTAEDDVDWCARLMSSEDPWRTLRRDYASCRASLEHPATERYLVRHDGERAGLLILNLNGPFTGYIQSICIAPGARSGGIGREAIAWAEERIFRESPNAFICVSSFNPRARSLYERLGYELVGVLKGFIVEEHDELLLRKTRGSWEAFRKGRQT